MDIITILGVAGLFLLRVGLPIVLLIGLGLMIDRWQTRRNAEYRRMPMPGKIIHLVEDDGEDVDTTANEQKVA